MGKIRIQDLLSDKDKRRFKEFIDHLIAEGKDEDVFTIVTKIGEKRIIEYKDTLLRDNEGRPVAVRGSARDITDRVKAEKEIRESEKRYRLLAENVRDIIWSADLDLKLTYISHSGGSFRGYTAGEVMNQSLSEALTPESYTLAMNVLAEELGKERSGQKHDPNWSRTLELEMNHRDGSTVWVEVVVSAPRDREGNITHILGVSRDITKRKIAENELRRSEESFRSLFEESPDANMLIQDSLFIDCNRATLDMFRMESKDGILMKHPADLSPEHQPDGSRSHEKVEEVLATAIGKGSYRTEWMHRRSDGSEFPVDISLITLVRGGRKIIYGTLRDITEQKRVEEERRMYEARLARSQRLEAIGTLAGGIAHDFNNILSSIIGYSELALDDIPEGSSLSENLTEVLKAGDRARDLVSQILTFSRQVQAEKRVIKAGIIVKEALKLLRSSIPTTIAIVHDIDPDAPAVLADHTQIHQVI
ncbi:MAG: PAS domain S-box protein, partial [Methanothrix sp.]|nr:PAS domain S-box protein [Methanothrix sp.]